MSSSQHVENHKLVTPGLEKGLKDYARRRMPVSKRRKPKHPPQSKQALEAAAKAKDPSPTWYVAAMAGLMVVGVVLVLLRFIFEWNQLVLVAGLMAIAAGFLMTTNYR